VRLDDPQDLSLRSPTLQALGMKVPADLYARSPCVYLGLEELTYPFHDQTIMLTACGRICHRHTRLG
jgi:putative transposase